MATQAEYYEKMLKKLVGGTIISTAIFTDGSEDADQYPGLIVGTPKGGRFGLMAMRDFENNGPGAFDLIDLNAGPPDMFEEKEGDDGPEDS